MISHSGDEEVLQLLRKESGLSTLDASSGYWKVQLGDEDQDKITLASHHCLQCLVSVLFGLTKVTTTLPRTVEVILASLKWQSALVN